MTEQQSHLVSKLSIVPSATVGMMAQWLRQEFGYERCDAELIIGMMMHAGQLRRVNPGSVSWALNREALL